MAKKQPCPTSTIDGEALEDRHGPPVLLPEGKTRMAAELTDVAVGLMMEAEDPMYGGDASEYFRSLANYLETAVRLIKASAIIASGGDEARVKRAERQYYGLEA